jgi:putative CocE/NonD family hydrolase
VRELEHVWIPLSDGTRLAARIWLPEDADVDPVPAILEYLPYRKNDQTAVRDAMQHPYFAGHGYASLRVDLRGCGDSDGVILDEYHRQEQDDALELLSWIATQPWCTGAVGMIGISWGGFNGLQIAARRPPELKAVISLCSTDDRYATDCHYMGGCMLADGMLPWGANSLAYMACPPDPHVHGESWRARWLERLERTPPFVENWVAHQRRDEYWRHGSICEDYAAIECPVYAVGGWADAYRDAIPRLLEHLPGPRKGLIGPWAHDYAEHGKPGPAIGFLQECLRWWDHWLKDIDTGVMREPMVRAWMQEPVEPRPPYAERPGRWVAEPAWPPPGVTTRRYLLGERGLGEDGPEAALECASDYLTGLDAGRWGSGGHIEHPREQSGEDGRSLTFTSRPLAERFEILGVPRVRLSLACDRPKALVAVRLCDVAPDGASLLVSRGLLNLTHRDGHDAPAPLEPGRRYTVTVELNAIAQALPAGHRLRVAVSPAYWPWAWPSPEPVTLTVFAGAESALELPLRHERPEDGKLAPFGEPEWAAAPTVETRRGETGIAIRREIASGLVEMTARNDRGGYRKLVRSELEYEPTATDVFTIGEGDPLSATVRSERVVRIQRGDWRTRVETVSTMAADADCFLITNTVDAYDGDERIFTKTWNFDVARDLV